jgi:hypothetical protein
VLGAPSRGDGAAERRQARRPRLGQRRRATRLQGGGHPRQRVALAGHRRGLLALARFEGREQALVVAGVVAPTAHGVDDHRVAVLHAAQNSMRSSTSAKPLASSTTETTSGLSAV